MKSCIPAARVGGGCEHDEQDILIKTRNKSRFLACWAMEIKITKRKTAAPGYFRAAQSIAMPGIWRVVKEASVKLHGVFGGVGEAVGGRYCYPRWEKKRVVCLLAP